MPPLPLRLILMRPRVAENVGAVARAMRNFGLEQWAWVQPAFDDLQPARRLAVHAEDLLQTALRPTTLDAAVQDCVWVLGTSSRHVRGKRRLGPRQAASELVRRAQQGTVALVFGDERSGLTNAEVERCHDLTAVAAEVDQPSLNLGQAALLYCHHVHEARRDASPPPPAPRVRKATDAELVGLEDALARALRGSGFLKAPERHALRDLLASLRRAELSHPEAVLWRAALESLARASTPLAQ
jgi:TrmH family RNA methyltransferase